MLLATTLQRAVQAAGLVLAFGGAIYATRTWRRRGTTGRLLALLPALAAGLLLFVLTAAPRALVLGDGPNGLTIERNIVIGTPPDPLAPSADGRLRAMWVLNRSSHTVRIEAVAYGALQEPDPPIVIPPQT